MQDFTLDLNDILDENLMPASFMLIEERDHNEWKNLSSTKLDDEFQCIVNAKVKDDGSFPTALHSMTFHRKMINEFLCSKFVAEKILENIQPNQMLKKRLGVADGTVNDLEKNNSLSFDESQAVRERMLFDEGSYQYKNWLAKTTTLNDIYRTMGINRSFNGNNQSPVDRHSNSRNDQYIDDMNDEEYEEGEVNGYMVQRPIVNSGMASNNVNALHTINANEKTGLGSFGNFHTPSSLSSTYSYFNNYDGLSKGYQYGPPTGQQDISYQNYHPAPMHPAVSYGGGGEMKTVNLKDIFEIALTTLAFLSFGMFIVQVIMCISMAKSSDQTVMLPMEMTAEGGEVEAAELEVRVKRSVDHFDPNINQINEISRRALQSFEAFIIAKHDKGQCLKKFICENNKFSRKTVDLQKYLIPIFGLGLSWISNKVTNQPVTANLDNLQASIIGLGNGNCTRFKCDIKFLNHMRK